MNNIPIYKIYYVILIVTLFSCKQNSDTLNRSDKDKIRLEIRQMFENYHNDIKKDGLDAEFKYLDNSSDFFWVPPGYHTALPFDSVQSILIANSKLNNAIEFSWDTLQIFPLTHDIANYSGIVNGTMTDTTNTQSTFKIIESGTLIKRKDGWKLLSGQSRNLPTVNN